MILPHIPTVWPIIPSPTVFNGELVDTQWGWMILSAFLFVAVSVFVGWVVAKVMRSKGFTVRVPVVLLLSAVISSALFLRFGFSVTMLQGLFLFYVLLYASFSDLTDHTMDDHVWVTVVALSLCSMPYAGVASMLLGAACVFIPQMLMALLPPHKTLGGADIKLSTALAFLLGLWRGLGAYLLGLIIAVIFISILNKIKRHDKKQPFALVPFLSVGAMIMFLI